NIRGRVRGGKTVSARRVRAITVRILAQFRHDRRTLALLFVAPIVILGLLDFLLRGSGSHPAVGIVNLDQGGIGGNGATRRRARRALSRRSATCTAAPAWTASITWARRSSAWWCSSLSS